MQINGEVRQKSSTSKMIFDVPTMIADISKFQELRRGDLLFTGTPEGVGQVRAGDELVCAIRNAGEKADLVRMQIKIA